MVLSSDHSMEYAQTFEAHPGLRRLFEDYAMIFDANPAALKPVGGMGGTKVQDINILSENDGALAKVHGVDAEKCIGHVSEAVGHIRDWLNTGTPVAKALKGKPEAAKVAFLEAMAGIQNAAINTGVEGPAFFQDALEIQQNQGLDIGY